MTKRIILLLPFLFVIYTASAQVFTDSNLPIVIITTDNNASIPDEPGVLGTMKIIYRGPGLRNFVTDKDSVQFLNYNGRIDIEKRGSYSQNFPKKAYGFTTLKADNVTNNNVKLLGMPSENDWVLNGLSSDPTLIREYLAMNLARQTGQYASRTAFCEVTLNGNYIGLYLLEEKVKVDDDRVDVIKIGTGDNTLPVLSGGYLTKTDKTTGGDPIAWKMSSYVGYNDCNFIHSWPKPEDVTTQQNLYIKTIFLDLQSASTSGNTSITTGFPSMIDIPSFVDYMLTSEITGNVDAYMFSTYYHKDRNGKLRAGPLWDMNLTFGNDLFSIGFDRNKTDVWQFSNGDNEGPKYYRDLFNNSQYKCYMSKRWNELTQPGQPFNLVSIQNFIDTTVALISEATVREKTRWGTVGSHQDSITKLKNWLALRIPWITGHIGSFTGCQSVNTPALVITRINYHPKVSIAYPDEDLLEFMEITNAGFSSIDLTGIYFRGTGLVYQFPAGSSLPMGHAIFLVSDSLTFKAKYGPTPFGQYTRQLSNDDENLVLADAFGNVIDQVHYYDMLPWPDADGNGMILQLISTAMDNSLAASWKAVSETTVGTDTPLSELRCSVFPNPTNGPLRISAVRVVKTVDLTDIQGRTLQSYPVWDKEFAFDISHLPTGIYFLRIHSETGSRTERIIRL
jgi:hypothetical protein